MADKAYPESKVLDYLRRQMKLALKDEGVNIKLLSDEDIAIIAIEWLRATIVSDYIQETLSDDIYDNDVISRILKKRKAYNY